MNDIRLGYKTNQTKLVSANEKPCVTSYEKNTLQVSNDFTISAGRDLLSRYCKPKNYVE